MQIGNSFAAKPQNLARLGTLANGLGHVAVQRRHLNLRAERHLREGQRQFAQNVIAAPFKQRVRTHRDLHLQIARRTAVLTCVTLAANAQHLPVVDAGGDVDAHRLAAGDLTGTVTGLAGRLDDPPASATPRTGGLGLHLTEGGLLDAALLTGTAALRTGLDRRRRRRAGAAALRTRLDQRHVNLFFAAACRLLKRDEHRGGHVAAAARRVGVLAATAAPEEGGEDVADVAEVHVEPAAAVAARARTVAGVDACMTELVIARTLVLVGQHLIRLVRLFEARLRLLVAGVQVGVVFLRHPPIRLLDLVVRSASLHAQNLIVIAFVRHGPLSPTQPGTARAPSRESVSYYALPAPIAEFARRAYKVTSRRRRRSRPRSALRRRGQRPVRRPAAERSPDTPSPKPHRRPSSALPASP